MQTFARELAVELLDAALDGRALESQAELADAFLEQVADVGGRLLERGASRAVVRRRLAVAIAHRRRAVVARGRGCGNRCRGR